jgi:hypothetical protein
VWAEHGTLSVSLVVREVTTGTVIFRVKQSGILLGLKMTAILHTIMQQAVSNWPEGDL